LRRKAASLPVAIDHVDRGDGRMIGEHRRRVAVDERVDLHLRRESLQRREDR
jgi:hypothetical protein